MKAVKILDGQTLVDIAVQELGDAARVMEIAELNGLEVTDILVVGNKITVPDFDRTKKSIVNLFSDDANKPASFIKNIIGDNDAQGIGYWRIEQNFKVQ